MPAFIGFLSLLALLLPPLVQSQLLPAVKLSAANQALDLQPTNSLCVSYYLSAGPIQFGPTTTIYATTTTSTQSLDCGGCLLAVQVHYPGGVHVCSFTS